jgi:hypothetical protein
LWPLQSGRRKKRWWYFMKKDRAIQISSRSRLPLGLMNRVCLNNTQVLSCALPAHDLKHHFERNASSQRGPTLRA